MLSATSDRPKLRCGGHRPREPDADFVRGSL